MASAGKPASTVTAAIALVPIAVFSNSGKRLRSERVAKIVKTDAQWQRQLPPLSYQVARRNGTERAFTGPLLGEHRKGVFGCLCCNTALYDSATKFESGTGWP
ncbi:MAG: peptide-methionine (R)-S-oxide reductase, partial [Luteimonas sp.]